MNRPESNAGEASIERTVSEAMEYNARQRAGSKLAPIAIVAVDEDPVVDIPYFGD